MKYIQLFFLFLTAFFLYTCTNPFSTRNPEQPEASGLYYEANDKPETVLENFLKSHQDKNSGKYAELFSQSDNKPFRFNPDPLLISQYGNTWTFTEEQEYFNKLIATDKQGYPKIYTSFNSTPVFTGIRQPSPVDSVISNILDYTVQVNYGDTVSTYFGSCFFKLYMDPQPPNYWSIYYWQDNARDSKAEESWSYLKIFIHRD